MAANPNVNDALHSFLENVLGLQGLTTNDMLAQIANPQYYRLPRITGDPANPAFGDIWADQATGEIKMQEGAGTKKVADEPPT